MEPKKIKRKHLKKRILRNISIVLLCSMIISTMVSYGYFEKIVREQKISEERKKLQQVSNQINFMTEDIQNFAKSIIADDVIQLNLEVDSSDTVFKKLKKKNAISQRLIFYNSLRNYISGSFMELKNGERYGSNSPFYENYLSQKFETKEFKTYKQHKDWIYSNPYYGINTWEKIRIICSGTQMLDVYQYMGQQGTLYIEIYFDYFLKQIQQYDRDYENVCLIGNDRVILYEKNSKERINQLFVENKQNLEAGVYKVKDGYLICEEVKAAGWKLCTLITNEYLWERSGFVPKFFFLSFLISIVLILWTTSRLLERTIRPITHLSEQMKHTDYNTLNIQKVVSTKDEIQTLYECYNSMLDEIQRGIEQRIEYERQKKDMEFDILLSQINPHYLYNVLNTVVYLSAAGKNEQVVKIINALIFTLQETLKLGEKNMETTVEKELELTKCYLEIQNFRYPNVFQVQINCAQETKRCIVPKTIIQPLVENGILHGILPSEKAGNIFVNVEILEEKLCITVLDDGVGISEESIRAFEQGEKIIYEENGRKHIGISNVRDRIQYLYGEPYGMCVTNRKSGGTQVTLFLPIIKTDLVKL